MSCLAAKPLHLSLTSFISSSFSVSSHVLNFFYYIFPNLLFPSLDFPFTFVLRSDQNLWSLITQCFYRYIQCMHQKLYHLTTADYEDFVNIVCSARAAFQITPEGNTQFKEWLQSIRRYCV
jgi:hypothetical protein